MTSTRPRSIFITCQGTRGDVQPYCNLGMALAEAGWSVLLGAPPEFQSFVSSHGLDFIDIGPAPTHTMYQNTVSDDDEGRAHRSSIGRPWAAYSAARRLFNPPHGPPFTLTWFQRILSTCRDRKPDVLMLVFTSWCGAAVIPKLLGHSTKVVISYPMPMAATGEFAVAMAGTGFTLGWSVLNKLQWSISQRMIVQTIHLAAARRNLAITIKEEKEAGRPLPGASTTTLDDMMNVTGLPTLFAFSPSLLSKPADWPANFRVIGQLQRRRSVNDAHKPLPTSLQTYLEECRNHNLHVIYIGFGSLGFFPPERVTQILDDAACAVEMVAESFPVRAIIQTTLSSTPGKTGALSGRLNTSGTTQADTSGAEASPSKPYFIFSESVDHTALFPQTSLIISHGGVGTVQAALGAGKPVISVCCLPTADQSFWADLCYRRSLSPRWMWVDALTPHRLADSIRTVMKDLDKFTMKAENVARDMATDDALSEAMVVLETEAEKAYASDLKDIGDGTVKRRVSSICVTASVAYGT